MSQRTRAGLLALCLLAVLWGAAAVVPLPYVTYYPGPTADILAEPDGDETVTVTGHRAFHDAGELRMTTVYVSQPEDDVTLPELVRAYFDPDAAVWPRSSRRRRRSARQTGRRQSWAGLNGRMTNFSPARIGQGVTLISRDEQGLDRQVRFKT